MDATSCVKKSTTLGVIFLIISLREIFSGSLRSGKRSSRIFSFISLRSLLADTPGFSAISSVSSTFSKLGCSYLIFLVISRMYCIPLLAR